MTRVRVGPPGPVGGPSRTLIAQAREAQGPPGHYPKQRQPSPQGGIAHQGHDPRSGPPVHHQGPGGAQSRDQGPKEVQQGLVQVGVQPGGAAHQDQHRPMSVQSQCGQGSTQPHGLRHPDGQGRAARGQRPLQEGLRGLHWELCRTWP